MIIIAGLFFVGSVAAGFYIVPRWNLSFETPSVDHRAIWEAHGISKYRMRVVAVALPAPVIGLELTVENERIIERSVLACDHPSDERWAWESNCEAIRRYYSGFAEYTISELLARADFAVDSTQEVLLQCNLATGNHFSRLSSEDEMISVGRACQDSVSVVNYDPEYGYPALIGGYTPNVMDGYSRITVEDFQILEQGK